MLTTTARDLWLEELRVRSVSPATITSYTRHIAEALPAMASFLDTTVDELTLEEVSRDSIVDALSKYRSRPDGRTKKKTERSATSVQGHLGVIKAFLGWCVETEKLGRNVALRVRAPKKANRVPKALSVEACTALLEVAGKSRWPERDRLLLLCGMALGLRLAEITSLTSASFSPSLEAPTHVTVLGKGSKERSVPVPKAVRDALEAYLPTRSARLERCEVECDALFVSFRPYTHDGAKCMASTIDGLGQTFDRLLRSAELKKPGLRAHMARHSFAAIALASRTFDLEELRQLLGHSSVATTQLYLKVDPARLSAGAESHPLALL